MVQKVLITGKNGRIGNAFVQYMMNAHPGEMMIDRISLRDDSFLDGDWSAYNAVIHMAGISQINKPVSNEEEKEIFYSVNRDLTEKVANKAKADGVRKFIYMSTMMVYGESAPIGQSFTIDKDTIPKPESYYGKSKFAAEDVLKMADDNYIVTVIREPVVYGEHFMGEFYKLQQFAEYCPIFPKIHSTKSYIYEGNLCELLRNLVYNGRIGILCPQNREIPTTSELYYRMRAAYGKKCVLVGGLQPILRLFSHVTRYVNATFNDMKYDNSVSDLIDFDYQVFSLEESIVKCLKR